MLVRRMTMGRVVSVAHICVSTVPYLAVYLELMSRPTNHRGGQPGPRAGPAAPKSTRGRRGGFRRRPPGLLSAEAVRAACSGGSQ